MILKFVLLCEKIQRNLQVYFKILLATKAGLKLIQYSLRWPDIGEFSMGCSFQFFMSHALNLAEF